MWYSLSSSLPTSDLCCDLTLPLATSFFPLWAVTQDCLPLKPSLNFGVLVPEEEKSCRRNRRKSFQKPLRKLKSMTLNEV